MELSHLIERLSQHVVATERISFADAPVFGVAFLTTNTTGIRGDVLYFGDATVLPHELPRDTTFNCVLLDADEPPERLTSTNNCNFLRVAEGADPFDCYNRAQSLLIDDQVLSSTSRRMLDALFSDRGLQHLVEVASEAMGNPIIVVDPSFHTIARHVGPIDPEDDSRYAVVMREELECQSVIDEGIGFVRDNSLDYQLRNGNAIEFRSESLGTRCVLGTVVVRGIRVAHALMVEHETPVTPISVSKFEQLLEFASQEYQKNPTESSNRGEAYGHFLANLLETEEPSPALIAHRLRSFDITPLGIYYVAVIKPRAGCFTSAGFDLLTARISSVLPNNIWARYDGSLVILFNRRRDRGLGMYTEEVLRRTASENCLLCGISNAFDDLVHIRTHYDQACSVIGLGLRYAAYAGEESFFHYCDYCYIELFDMASAHKNVRDYCRPEILRLMDYDGRHHTDLMTTFFTYLECAGNTATTSKVLNVHKNTLLYRMGRIREIIGNDLTSGEALFMYHLSFRALIFLDLFDPSPEVCLRDVAEKNESHQQPMLPAKE